MLPIRTCTLLFAAGIVLTNSLQISPLVIPFIGVSGFFCIFIFIACSLRKPVRFISLHSLRQSCLLYAASLLCGSYSYLEHTALNETHISLVTPYHAPVTIGGEIISLSHNSFTTELHLEAKKIYADTHYTPTHGKLIVHLSPADTLLVPGKHLLIAGQMTPIQGARNPGDFDYQAYLANSTIHAQLDGQRWIELTRAQSFFSRLRTQIYSLRQAISAAISDASPSLTTSALLQALIIGNQDALPASTRHHFRASGLAHLLAVSGLHVACVGLIVYTLLGPLCLRPGMHWQSMELTRAVVTLFLLSVYVCITDFKPAVFRATVMTSIFVLAPLFQRPVASINNVFVAAFILLLINPTHLFQPGFQLSFSAVTSIIHFYPRLPSVSDGSGYLRTVIRYAVNSFNVSLAATLGVLPISLFYFHMASPGGLLLNLAAIPATTGILLSGLLVLASTPFSQELASVFGFSADFCSSALLVMAKYGALSLPSFSVPPSSTRNLFFALVGLMIFLVASLNIQIRWRFLCVVLCFVVFFQWIPLIRQSNHPTLEVLFFDVGHGDAALVTMPNGRQLLIDTGDVPWQPEAHVIATHLNRYRIECIDSVLITHPDRDHVGGLQQLLDEHCIQTIYTSGDARFDIEKQPFHQALAAGDRIELDASVAIRVLSPSPSLINKPNRNDGSLVLLIEYGDTRLLFTGDAEQEAEQQLITNYPGFLSSEVIKVGHHGSQTSSSPSFVDQSTRRGTQYAVISTGPQTRYGLPDEHVLKRWLDTGAIVHNTSTSGALWLYTDGRSVKQKHW